MNLLPLQTRANIELVGSTLSSNLTRVGGGVFGNETAWIDDAIRRALKKGAGVGLDVRLVSYGQPDPELLRLLGEFNSSVREV